VSPPVTLPTSGEPRLRFWHWFKIHPNHYGQVWIRFEDGKSEDISPKYSSSSINGWTPACIDLTKYAGQKVQFLFYFTDYVDGDWPGWFIDDIEIAATPQIDLQAVAEDFEGGWSEWCPNRGNWFVGKPEVGPLAALSGTNCAAVTLTGVSSPISGLSSSLVSPRFLIPDANLNPRLSFQHWFKIHPNHYGQVRIRFEDGQSEDISPKYSGDSLGWTPALLPLGKYAGKVVNFLFYFTDYIDSAFPGWFIDDVRLLPRVINTRPRFEVMNPQLAHALENLQFVVKALDSDPGQTLKYSMDTNTAPSSAQFDEASGTFSWTPTLEE
jgi:hypothetical protein